MCGEATPGATKKRAERVGAGAPRSSGPDRPARDAGDIFNCHIQILKFASPPIFNGQIYANPVLIDNELTVVPPMLKNGITTQGHENVYMQSLFS